MSVHGEEINGSEVLKHLEQVGRTCYKSEDKVKEGSAEKFIRGIVASGHGSIIEHYTVSAKIITSRDVTHQLVRHRIASYAQESQRYCNYSLDKFGNEVVFVKPVYLQDDLLDDWKQACKSSEDDYFNLIANGMTAEEARAVLPNCCKTEIVMTMNLREWRHFFEVRCDHHAQEPIRLLAFDILAEMAETIPVVFDDLFAKFCLPAPEPTLNTISYIKGNKVICELKLGDKVISTGVARCHPNDEFDFEEGYKYASKRMFGEEA
jgi:thymidylate synthase (FAD)